MSLYYTHLIQSSFASDLIAAYPLSNANDAHAGLNGVATGVVFDSTNAVNGNAGQFTLASNSRVLLPDNNLFSFTNGTNDLPYSMKCNIYLRTIGVLNPILWKGNGSANPSSEYYFFVDATNRIRIAHCDKTTINWRIEAFTSTTLALNTPYNIVLTYNGNGSWTGWKVYVNGVSQTMTNASVGTYTTMNNTTFQPAIGNASGVVIPFRGMIDEFYIFKKELSLAEVTTLQTNFYPNF